MKTTSSMLNTCPICGSPLADKNIDYIDRGPERYLLIRDVPVQECFENGHQFFHASVAKEIERLFELDRDHGLRPKEIISIPVVDLEMV